MNTIYLSPTDLLFFRDGRPMGGAHAGHGAAWPLPNVLDSALHAALWRSGLKKQSHGHGAGDSRHFGALTNAGPFPVRRDATGNTWYFPRPSDACKPGSALVTHHPSAHVTPEASSLATPLKYGVESTIEPSKDVLDAWWSGSAWDAYLHGIAPAPHFAADRDVFATEHTYGIAIDPATATTGHGEAEGMIYSAQYLRLREDSKQRWLLGLCAACPDKGPNGSGSGHNGNDLLQRLFERSEGESTVIVGGQQRVCSVELQPASRQTVPAPLPLPRGMTNGFTKAVIDGKERWLVKWIPLTPAIWPEIPNKDKKGNRVTPHPGGWLPNWVFVDWDSDTATIQSSSENGKVLLVNRAGKRTRRFDSATGKHVRTAETENSIDAQLVAAIVPKPHIVTGWTVHHEAGNGYEGAKHTHLAVPAGAVYYFECGTQESAQLLAAALNWHGKDDFTTIRNRRSTLLGEKGFGLGVCGTWQFHPGGEPA